MLILLVRAICHSWKRIKTEAKAQLNDRHPNLHIARDGACLNIKEKGTETYHDKTQKWVVKALDAAAETRAAEKEEGRTSKRRKLLGKLKHGATKDKDEKGGKKVDQ